MITLEQYLTAPDGTRRDVTHASEYSPEIEAAAKALLEKVNELYRRLDVKGAKSSSGWRPPSVNRQTKHAAKASNHMTGHAIDTADVGHRLARLLLKNLALLRELGLYMEDPGYTPTWVHLQDVATRSGNQVFIPY